MERLKIQISLHHVQSYQNSCLQRTVNVTKRMRSRIRVIFTSISHHLNAVGSKSSSSHSRSAWDGQVFNQWNFKQTIMMIDQKMPL